MSLLLSDQPAKAIATFRRLLDLIPGDPDANNNLGTALATIGDHAGAIVCYRRAITTDPDFAAAHMGLSMSLLALGRLREGFAEYEWRPMTAVPAPRWNGQYLAGETVVLHAEQGHGDTLQFCRYAPLVAAAGGRVVLVVPKALRRLLSTLDGVQIWQEGDGLPERYVHCPLMSLPHVFGASTIPAAPYLRADAAPFADFLGKLSGLKVGLVWAGRSRSAQPLAVAIDRRRSMALSKLAPLFDVPNCSFVSLQLGEPAAQIADLPPWVELHDVSDRLKDWKDTAALVAGLDLVISVDTAVAHLAGAVGKPVWMLNRYDTCWRWLLNRSDSPWYPSMRVFRQAKAYDWRGVVAEVAAALRDLARHHRPSRTGQSDPDSI